MPAGSRRVLLATAFVVAAAGFAFARQATPAAPTTPPAPKRDTQAAYEPPSGPGVGQAFLRSFEGDWDVERIFYPPSGGSPSRTPGDCTQTMVQDGRFLESRFTFRQAGRTSTGTGVSGFDPQTGLFTTFWYDSRSTRMSIRQSKEPFDGKEIVLWSVSLGGSHGQEHQSRTVTHLEDGGRKLIHRQFNRGADGKEHVLMELVMTRKR
jgi:hypothetical protein